MDKKKLRNDVILILSLLLIVIIPLIIILITSSKNNLVAKIYVNNELKEVVDLNSIKDKEYEIEGVNGIVHVHVKDGSIGVISSNCPHQDCVHMGYVNVTNHPIICAYNQVYIIIEGNSSYDTEIG